jgi:hypothetical protein
MAWATVEDVRARWADAPLDDALLLAMIEAAHIECVAWVQTAHRLPPVGGPVPANLLEGEVLQVEALYTAHQRDGDVVGFGAEGFAVRVRPLGPDVKQKLVPKTRVPVIG